LTDIRRLTAADAAAFHALRLEAMAAEPESFGTDILEERTRPLDRVAATLAATAVFGGFVDGEGLCAMAGFARHEPLRERHKGRVWSMYVRDSVRGRGLGGRLLDAVIAHAGDEVDVLQLIVVSTNAPAVALYESRGFQRWGLEPFALRLADGRHTTDAYYWLPLSRGPL
jgi:ribosomal protein S18 acetylase RimI-like enzyme